MSKIHQYNVSMVEQLEKELLNTSLSSEERSLIENKLATFKWYVALGKL